MASKDVDFGRLQKDIGRQDTPLREILDRADAATSRREPQPERDRAESELPHVRSPRISPEGIFAEFEAHARSCEHILNEIRTMLRSEEESWEHLATQYRQLGKIQAEAVHDMLARIAIMRDARTQLSKGIEK